MVIDPGKVAVYIRWSTDDQESGTTLQVQRDACMHQARAWQLGEIPESRIFVDDGYSGENLQRPGITRIRELVRQREIECVIVYSIDRLSRNIVDATSLVLREWDGLCHLKCIMQPVDTTTDLGRMIFGILAMFADFERTTIRNRTFSGKLRRALEGRNPGISLPFGYSRGDTPGSIIVDEAKAALAREIFERYAGGTSFARIAYSFNDRGIPSPTGAAWNGTTLKRLIRNRTYTGILVYGKSRRNPRRSHDSSAPDRIRRETPLAVAENACPPIISQELFERCQQVRKTKARAVSAGSSGAAMSSPALLTGLARCRCGHMIQAHDAPRRDGTRKAYYMCTGHKEKGNTFCDCGYMPRQLIDDFVLSEIRSLSTASVRAQILKRVEGNRQQRLDDARARLAELQSALQRLAAQEARLRRDYRNELLTAGAYSDLQREIETERAEVERQRLATEAEIAACQAMDYERAQLELRLNQVTLWDNLPVAERKQILRELVSQLTLYRRSRGDGEQRDLHIDLQIKYSV